MSQSTVSSDERVIKFLMTFQVEENKDGVRSAVGVGGNGSGVLRGKYLYFTFYFKCIVLLSTTTVSMLSNAGMLFVKFVKKN